VASRMRERCGHPGYGFTSYRVVRRRRPADNPWMTEPRSTGATRDSSVVPSISATSDARPERNPRCPSESSVPLLAANRCRFATSSRNWLLVQSTEPDEVPRLWVPRSHFAVSRFLGCVGFLRRAALTTLSDQCTLSSSFAFLQSLAQRHLAGQPQPASTSHGLSLPSAHQGSEVYLPRALPQPATFRPQGLATLSAVYALRARAGFVSRRRRSWDSPFGAFSSHRVSTRVSARLDPHTVSPAGIPDARRRRAGPTGRGSWALTPAGIPGDRQVFSPPNAGCSLGFHLPGFSSRSLARDFARLLSRAFARRSP
jgi:hypothetical protein